MAFKLLLIALTVQKLLRFYYENYLSGSTFECESGATNVKDEPSILSFIFQRSLSIFVPCDKIDVFPPLLLFFEKVCLFPIANKIALYFTS